MQTAQIPYVSYPDQVPSSCHQNFKQAELWWLRKLPGQQEGHECIIKGRENVFIGRLSLPTEILPEPLQVPPEEDSIFSGHLRLVLGKLHQLSHQTSEPPEVSLKETGVFKVFQMPWDRFSPCRGEAHLQYD